MGGFFIKIKMPENNLTFDPLGSDFIQTTQEIVREEIRQNLEENNIQLIQLKKEKKEKKIRVKKVKFYMSAELKNRLRTMYHNSADILPAKQIAEALLNLKKVPVDSINYLGLSNDDFTKISYSTPDRIERLKDKSFEIKYIVPGTLLIYEFKANAYGAHDRDGQLCYGKYEEMRRGHFLFNRRKLNEPKAQIMPLPSIVP